MENDKINAWASSGCSQAKPGRTASTASIREPVRSRRKVGLVVRTRSIRGNAPNLQLKVLRWTSIGDSGNRSSRWAAVVLVRFSVPWAFSTIDLGRHSFFTPPLQHSTPQLHFNGHANGCCRRRAYIKLLPREIITW